ncbi:MAG: ribokinase [Paracoccaceae bacterium]|nr:ribokinase [Paracoccaceae bacterium]
MGRVAILGVFVADCTFRAERQPKMGETLLGKSFALGPGGKGSNQAVAAARAGAEATFISKLGADAFADLARGIWGEAGVSPAVPVDSDSYTGAAYVFVDDDSGDNAIIICPGVAATISPDDLEREHATIAAADVFMTQLEQPLDAAMRGLEIARAAGTRTILNPAPAALLPDGMLGLCDIVTPNESEAEGLTGVAVSGIADAERAADALIAQGAGAAVITLGENGALYRNGSTSLHVPAMAAGPVVETTGAGDAFNGGFAAALAEGASPEAALRFGTATAAISVTRAGTAPSMPARSEIEALLAKNI